MPSGVVTDVSVIEVSADEEVTTLSREDFELFADFYFLKFLKLLYLYHKQ